MFSTIRQASRSLGIPEHLILTLVSKGECPGIRSGNRFLVHTEGLRELFERMSRKNVEVSD